MSRLAVSHMVTDHEAAVGGKESLQWALQSMQHELGTGLIAALTETGKAVVDIGATSYRDHGRFAVRLGLEANITPVEKEVRVVRELVLVPHFEYFPMDWICSKCGCIIDGICYPRMCPHCGAPKPVRGV